MLTDMDEIMRMSGEAMGLLEWAAVPLGHPLRNHAYAYCSWGIAITPENIEALRAESKRQYCSEWAGTDENLNRLIALASIHAGLSDTNKLMNLKIAEYAMEHIAGLEYRPIRLYDIGTGAGGTILALLEKAQAAGLDLSSLEITLVEPSGKRLGFVMEEIQRRFPMGLLGAGMPRVGPLQGTVDAILGTDSGSADLVIQNAAIHHESFKDHLSQICRILRPGMPFISGDWHEGTYETPARIYWLYSMLQNPFDKESSRGILDFVLGNGYPEGVPERPELKQFRKMFALDSAALASAFGKLTDSEKRASAGGMKYWLEVAKLFTNEGRKSPEVVIQGHERISCRLSALVNAGFVFDSESRRKYHEVIRDKGYGELGAVMVPKKPGPAMLR